MGQTLRKRFQRVNRSPRFVIRYLDAIAATVNQMRVRRNGGVG
jgi:hypothetical protein